MVINTPFLLFFIRALVTVSVLACIIAKTLILGIFALSKLKTLRPKFNDKSFILLKIK